MRITTTSGSDRRPMHFPPAGIVLDSTSTIVAPSAQDIVRFTADVCPKVFPEFMSGLMKRARRRRYQPRYRALNLARLELARLCIDRMQIEGLDVPDDDDEVMNADDFTKQGLVGEAFHIFGKTAARASRQARCGLRGLPLGVSFQEVVHPV